MFGMGTGVALRVKAPTKPLRPLSGPQEVLIRESRKVLLDSDCDRCNRQSPDSNDRDVRSASEVRPSPAAPRHHWQPATDNWLLIGIR